MSACVESAITSGLKMLRCASKQEFKKSFFQLWKLKVCCCCSAKDLISGLWGRVSVFMSDRSLQRRTAESAGRFQLMRLLKPIIFTFHSPFIFLCIALKSSSATRFVSHTLLCTQYKVKYLRLKYNGRKVKSNIIEIFWLQPWPQFQKIWETVKYNDLQI